MFLVLTQDWEALVKFALQYQCYTISKPFVVKESKFDWEFKNIKSRTNCKRIFSILENKVVSFLHTQSILDNILGLGLKWDFYWMQS